MILTLCGCPGPTDTDPDTDLEGCADADDDGFADVACGGEDCDDARAEAFPGAAEQCNGLDDDCDGEALWEADDACADCAAAGYFSELVAAAPEDRRDVVLDLLEPVRCDYRTATSQMFLTLDKRDGEVTCVYTGESVEVGADKPDGNVMNTEHTWPRSLGADDEPAACDLHHLYPTMSDANQARGNLPFGEVLSGVEWSDGGSKASDALFEPRDDHKGNVGRAMLYFALRYGYELDPGQRTLFLDWSASDPPDADDLARDATIARLQSSPNPFVVCTMAAEDLAR